MQTQFVRTIFGGSSQNHLATGLSSALQTRATAYGFIYITEMRGAISDGISVNSPLRLYFLSPVYLLYIILPIIFFFQYKHDDTNLYIIVDSPVKKLLTS